MASTPRAYNPDACLAVRCGVPFLARAVAGSLAAAGLQIDPHARTTLLLDAPSGYALHALEAADAARAGMIVATWNPCPEYVEDLWDLGPAALLSGEYLDRDPAGRLADAFEGLASGERVRLTPWRRTALTPNERRMLHYSVRGTTNREVGMELHVQEQTVSNNLTRIYDKLGLEGREHAVLYYWGVWPYRR